MNRLDQLAELQSIDMRIDENSRARREAEAVIKNNSALAPLQQSLAAGAAESKETRARLVALELEVKGIEDNIKMVESRLYDGRTSNPKELSGLEQDEEMLKRHKAQVEDLMLEEMARLETLERAERATRDALVKASGERSGAVIHATDTLANLDAGAAKLRQSREALLSRLPPGDVGIYENLRREKKGRAVSRLRGPACEVCGFSLPSGVLSRVRVGQEIEFCSNCGRILIP